MADYPNVVVLVVCRVLFLGAPDDNAQFTGWRDTEWDLSQGVMHCRRQEVQVYDKAVDQGADEIPFNPTACMRAAMMLGPQYDVDHRDKPWRFFKAACPTPIYPDRDGNGEPDRDANGYPLPPIAWKLPECPDISSGTMVCEGDTEI